MRGINTIKSVTMKKIIMAAAALCCMTMMVLTSCNNIGDNPVALPESNALAPLLKWGCSFADVDR